MSDLTDRLKKFVAYGEKCKSEKGDAQVFLDRLFQAFGHDGFKEAGAVLEFDVKSTRGRTKWVDLIWKPRVLIEMKKRGEKLSRHYAQAFEYWQQAVPRRPRYVVLCNFAELWIYDFDLQLYEPVDKLNLNELPARYRALGFLLPEEQPALFNNNKVEVTRRAADWMADLFNHIVGRGEDRDRAQRFMLQCVVAMFAQGIDMMPSGLFTDLVEECRTGKASTYDLFGQLFRQMNSKTPARAGRFKAVPWFNGGLFEEVNPIELVSDDLTLLASACSQNWAKVEPPIFGELFQHSIGEPRRHALGAHFTLPAEIHRIITPTIVTPWRQRIARAKSATELLAIGEALTKFHVLDPACGSGNFLYIAYREMKRLETQVLSRIYQEFGVRSQKKSGGVATISIKQFHGIDVEPFAVELAKVALVLGKKLALDEANEALGKYQQARLDIVDQPLPLENLDENIHEGDALFVEWPEVDAIIGNPPYQAKNKAQGELTPKYMHEVRKRYPEVPGHADYCVYWFRRAHDELRPGRRAGLVGTNTIRQNKSRVGGLDYIVGNGGTITEAVSTQVWPGEAVVHVSIVNWIKGASPGLKTLWEQKGDHVGSPWEKHELPVINSALSPRGDVTTAKDLTVNLEPKTTFQGQTPGVTRGNGFIIPADLAAAWISEDKANSEVLFKYLIGDDLLDNAESSSDRLILDFGDMNLVEASRYERPFEYVKKNILEKRQKAAKNESARNTEVTDIDDDARVNKHHANFLKHWWQLAWRRGDMLEALAAKRRYIACSRVTRRPIFEFVSSEIHPGDALQVFALDDDYSFGILQSDIHWQWFTERCSGLKIDPRYTSESVYATFPWPQTPSVVQATLVARAGAELRRLRRRTVRKEGCGLRALYRLLELPGDHPLKEAHRKLDDAVRAAYHMKPRADLLQFLLNLNHKVAKAEADGDPDVVGPGLPPAASGKKKAFTSKDCVAF
jgi:type II restriction/modification system DNA methylase subunit YeeA